MNSVQDGDALVATKVSPSAKKALLILNCILLSVGNCGGPLVLRLYFIHGGNRVWLSAFLQTSGWPFILIVLVVLYFRRRYNNLANCMFFLRVLYIFFELFSL